jgi:chromosome segregation ATPase
MEPNEAERRIEELESELEEANATINRLENDLNESKEELRSLTVQFVPNTGEEEPKFREAVRDLLDLDWSARDERIFDEVRRLKP